MAIFLTPSVQVNVRTLNFIYSRIRLRYRLEHLLFVAMVTFFSVYKNNLNGARSRKAAPFAASKLRHF